MKRYVKLHLCLLLMLLGTLCISRPIQTQAASNSITLDAQGGKIDKNVIHYDVSIGVSSFPTPTRSGYSFDGWYTVIYTDTGWTWGTRVSSIGANADTNITELKAKWIPSKVSVTYKYQESDGTTYTYIPSTYAPSTVDYDDNLQVGCPSRVGYKFKGWSYNGTVTPPTMIQLRGADKKPLDIPPILGCEIRIKEDNLKATLIPKWEKITYTVVYDLNGGDSNYNGISRIDVETGDTNIPSPSRGQGKGYDFDGWYCSDFDDFAIDTDSKLKNVSSGTKVEKFDNEFLTKFLTEMAKKSETADNTIIHLYANWTTKEFKITYKLGKNGVNNAENPTVVTPVMDTVKLKAPTRPGYVFQKWTKNGKKVTKVSKGTKKITLKAVWKEMKPTHISSFKYNKKGTKTLKVSWVKVKGGYKYNVQVATDPNFTNIVLDKDGIAKTSVTLKDVQEGQTYWARVRTVLYAKLDGSPQYSTWSKKKSKELKK